jgi:hypothetical protein
MQLVLDMPAEWRGRFVPFSLIAAMLNLSDDAVRAALFAVERQHGVYVVNARDSLRTNTHVASGSLKEPPRPQGVHDLGDLVAEKNWSTAAEGSLYVATASEQDSGGAGVCPVEQRVV